MKYLKWTIYFPEGSNEGTTPEDIIREKNGWAEGAIALSNNEIIGYASDESDLSGLSNYDLQELTQEEALDLAQTINPSFYLADDGKIGSPTPLAI